MVRARLSLMMFAQYFAWGVWLVPLGTYMSKGLHFDAIVGVTFGLIGIATILSTLLIGAIADRFFASQKIMAWLCLGAGAALLCASLITQSPTLFLIVCLVHFLFYASTIPLATSIAFSAVGDVGREFPRIRVWGTIGWIVAGLLIGAIAGAAQTALPMKIAGTVYILLGLYSFTLPNTPPRATGERINVTALFGLDIVAGYRDRPFWVFIGTMFVLMLPKCFYDTYANTYLVEKNLAISLAGFRLEATAIQTAGQIFELLLLITLPFLLRVMGIKRVLLLGMAAWALRFAAFAYGYQGAAAIAPLMLFGIIIHGICYDFVFVSSQIYVDRKFDPKARARAQAFLALVTQGVGTLVWSNVAGMVYGANSVSPLDHDWRSIWLVPASVALLATLAFGYLFREVPMRFVRVSAAVRTASPH